MSSVPLKRPRPVRSCLICRAKKLRCDREQPCAQCIRADRADQCGYDPRSGSVGLEDTPRRRNIVGRTIRSLPQATIDGNQSIDSSCNHNHLEDRIRRLENLADDKRNGNNASASVYDIFRQSRVGDLQPKDVKKYYGLDNTRSLVVLFPDVVSFINHAVLDPNMKSDFDELHHMFPKRHKEKSELHSTSSSLETIVSLLPSRDKGSRLISLYEQYFPKIYQPLHLKTFRMQYDQFWQVEHHNNVSIQSEFAPLLSLVVAFASVFEPSTESPAYATLQKTCNAVENWLMNLDPKKQLQPLALQTHCLLISTLRLLPVPLTVLWHHTGNLIRSAMVLKLHKDPFELDPDMPQFQVDLRRQLWFDIANLDVDISILCCLPSLVQTINYTCKLPSGSVETEGNLIEQDNPYQSVYAKSLPLRLLALQILVASDSRVANIRQVFSELERQQDSLLMHLKALEPQASLDQTDIYNNIFLIMGFKTAMVSLITFGLQCEGFIQNMNQTNRCISLCMAVIAFADPIDSELPYDGPNKQDLLWDVIQAFNCEPILRAAYTACFCLKLEHDSENMIQELYIPKSIILRTLEDLLYTYIEKKSYLRVILKQLLALGLAVEQTKTARNDAGRQTLMNKALQKMLQMCKDRNASDQQVALSCNSLTIPPILMGPVQSSDSDQFMYQDFGLDSMSYDWDFTFLADQESL